MSDSGLSELREARREFDAIVGEIRTVRGFADFLAPPDFADVANAAAGAPVVYLAAAEPGGLALVVRGEDVEHVELAALTAEALRARLGDHLSAYRDHQLGGDRTAWTASLDALCGWLWEVAMGPVCAALAGAAEATLIAGGLLGLVPLHAAWTEDAAAKTGRRYAIDGLALSYAPNARMLSAARAAAGRLSADRLVAVAEPRPVSGAALPYASLEGDIAAAALKAAPVVLRGGAATRRNFLRKATEADVLHLACHGYADLVTPLESGIRLAGNRTVTVRDLIATEVAVRLAVLSACETSLPGTELPDEVVALPTGLLQAGVAGVIASLWAVPDRATAMLMTEFYRRWPSGDRTPAQALCEAQGWLRDSTNEEKRRAWRETPWLPLRVTEDFDRSLAFREPCDRDHSDIRAWGAFAHVGA